jgi:prefoldin subunit 5
MYNTPQNTVTATHPLAMLQRKVTQAIQKVDALIATYPNLDPIKLNELNEQVQAITECMHAIGKLHQDLEYAIQILDSAIAKTEG